MRQRFEVRAADAVPHQSQKAVDLLRGGAIGLVPTGLGYVLVAALGHKAAAERLRRLSGDDDREPAVLLCRDLREAAAYALIDDAGYRALRFASPRELVLAGATKRVPRRLIPALRSRPVALLFAGHEVDRALLERLDAPLLVGMRRRKGWQSIAALPLEIERQLDFALDAGPCTAHAASVIDLLPPPRRGWGLGAAIEGAAIA